MNELVRLRRRLHRAHRLIARRRRPLTAGCVALSVLALVHVLAPPPPATTPVLIATHDLTGGTHVSSGDVRVVDLPRAAAPAAALSSSESIVGQTLAGPVGAGEVVTEQRLVGEALVRGFGADLVAVPVRMADAEAVHLLRVGDRIDVFAATAVGDRAADVVRDAPVVAVPQPGSEPSRSDGALVVLAVSPDDAARIAQEAARAPLSLSLRG